MKQHLKIKLLREPDLRAPKPLSWEDQTHFFGPFHHLATMALFIANTGLWDAEICGLHWEWEARVHGLDGTAFVLPAGKLKSRYEGLVLLNRTAQNIVEAQRGKHPSFVFNYRGKPITRMLNSAWLRARKVAGIECGSTIFVIPSV